MKKQPSFNLIVLEGIALVLLWISDRVLYPEGGWPIIRVGQYILMLVIVVAMIIQFIAVTKANK